MTRLLLLLALCVGAANAGTPMAVPSGLAAGGRELPVESAGATPANGHLINSPTLTFDMPTVNVAGDTLTGYLRWEVAYQVQARAWIDSSAAMKADSATWARLWPTVASQMSPRVVASGWVPVGAHVTVSQPPVSPLEGSAWYLVRACRDVCGYWSRAVAKQ